MQLNKLTEEIHKSCHSQHREERNTTDLTWCHNSWQRAERLTAYLFSLALQVFILPLSVTMKQYPHTMFCELFHSGNQYRIVIIRRHKTYEEKKIYTKYFVTKWNPWIAEELFLWRAITLIFFIALCFCLFMLMSTSFVTSWIFNPLDKATVSDIFTIPKIDS
jgi:hypothetical protein